MIEHKEREARVEETAVRDEVKNRPRGEVKKRPRGGVEERPRDELPEDVPAKATITIKNSNDNRYYYWQWREGDTVTSKYEAPVDPDE